MQRLTVTLSVMTSCIYCTLQYNYSAQCSKVKRMPPKMTTSSYAVLGLLNLKPWTAYQLTQQAQRSLRYAWPKSERLLYSEPKKLVKLGYATTHTEQTGNRTSNVYEITDEGRSALTEWTSSRTQPPRIEIEALLRLLFADHGTIQDVNGALDDFEADIGEHHDSIVELMVSYLDGGHPFPERTHLSVLFASFQIEMFKSIERWIDFARSEIDEWPTTEKLGMTRRTEELTRLLAEDKSPLDT
jgi:PadR family transcriptional regulator AphA